MRSPALARGALPLALLLLVPACRGRAPSDTVPTYEVRRQRFARVVEADGALKPETATPVTIPPDADFALRVTWLLPDGSVVKKGDLLARFDDLEIKETLANAGGDRRVALARKEKESLLQRTAQDQRRRESTAAERELELTRAFARRDPTIFSRNEIIESDIDAALQAEKVASAKSTASAEQVLGRSKVAQIEVEAKKAADALARAEKGLQALAIHAEHDGVLTLRRNGAGDPVRVGDTAWRGNSIAELARVERMQAEVFVLEAEAAGLAVGRRAEVELEGQPGQTFAASIKRVDTVAKRRQPRSPTQYFGVTLALDKTEPDRMKPGLRVRARLLLAEAKDGALVVPRPAAIERDGGWVVFRRGDKGRFEAVPVKLGPSSAGLLTIESGLAEGDVIALRDPDKAAGEAMPAATPEKNP